MTSRYPTSPKSIGGYQTQTSSTSSSYNVSSFDFLVNADPDFRRLVQGRVGGPRTGGPSTSWTIRNRSNFNYRTFTPRVPFNRFGALSGALEQALNYYNYRTQPILVLNGWTQTVFCPVAKQEQLNAGLGCFVGSSAASNVPIGSPVAPYQTNLTFTGNRRPGISPGTEICDGAGRFKRPVPSSPGNPHPPRIVTMPTDQFQLPNWADPHPRPSTVPLVVVPIPPPFVVVPYVNTDTTPGVVEGTTVGPGTLTSVTPVPPDRPRPPPPGTREKKFRVELGPIATIFRNEVIDLTEKIELIECFHDALPKAFQAKPTHRLGDMPGAQAFNPNALVSRPQEKFAAVWQHWQHLQHGKLIGCLVLNHVSDQLLAKVFTGAQGEATKRQVILGLLG